MPSSLAAGADAALSGLIAERCARQVDSVEARFVAKKDFYYAWALQGRSATVQISDYLQGAPDVVLADFGEMVVRRALELDWEVPASFTDFVRTDGFVETRRPVFIRRSKNLLRTDAGEFRSIPDSVGGLWTRGWCSRPTSPTRGSPGRAGTTTAASASAAPCSAWSAYRRSSTRPRCQTRSSTTWSTTSACTSARATAPTAASTTRR